jgi:hypothetical protein
MSEHGFRMFTGRGMDVTANGWKEGQIIYLLLKG